MELTAEQCAFFETFGYIYLPGLLADDVGWITEEHRMVFEDNGVVHDGSQRSMIVPFIDQRERLCTLLDHPGVLGVLSSLLGEDFNYLGGDGNYYSGDTGWHPDGGHPVGLFAKFHIYLDELQRDTGCIRVIPGSHLMGEWRERLLATMRNIPDNLGMGPRDIPCSAVETIPGDVVVFDHNIYHASFGGGPRRRHFCLNVCKRANTEREIEELDGYVRPRRMNPRPLHYAEGSQDLMRRTAGPERMVHLEQVIDRESAYAAAS